MRNCERDVNTRGLRDSRVIPLVHWQIVHGREGAPPQSFASCQGRRLYVRSRYAFTTSQDGHRALVHDGFSGYVEGRCVVRGALFSSVQQRTAEIAEAQEQQCRGQEQGQRDQLKRTINK